MANYGGFYTGGKKKIKKQTLEKKAQKFTGQSSFVLPKIEIIGKGGKKDK